MQRILMKKVYLMLLMAIVMLSSAKGCDDQVADYKEQPGKYKETGKIVISQVKAIDLKGKTALEKTKAVVDTVNGVATTVSFIPGVQAIVTPITAGLTAISIILGYFTAKKSKAVKVITEDRDKHEKRSNNYREVINDGIVEGDHPETINVETLSAGMDKDTKAHFNDEGKAKI